MKPSEPHIFSPAKSDHLDNGFRRLLQNPYKVSKPYVRPGMTILELGCGNGYFTFALSDLTGPSGKVFALDVQTEMLKKLKARIEANPEIKNIEVRKNAPHTTGITGKIDFALAAYVFHELPCQRSYLKEIYGLLNYGCHLLIIEPDFIVSKAAFQKIILYATETGFEPLKAPGVRFSKSVLLQKKK